MRKVIAIFKLKIFEAIKLKNKIKTKNIKVRSLISCKEIISVFLN